MLDKKTPIATILKVKFIRNLAILDMTKSSLKIVVFSPKEMLGISDFQSIG